MKNILTIKKIVLLCSALLFTLMGLAQQPFMWRVTTDDGLKTNMVYDLEIDRNGKVWFGHFGGIASYDGQKVTMHAKKQDLSMSLTNLQFDGKGNIYCMNFTNEIYRYEPSTDKLKKIKGNPMVNAPFFGDFVLLNNKFYLQLGRDHYVMAVANDSFKIDSTFRLDARSRFVVNSTKPDIYVAHRNAETGEDEFINLLNDKVVFHEDSFLKYSPQYQAIHNNLMYQFLDSKNEIIEYNLENNSISRRIKLPENANDKLVNSVVVVDNEIWVSSTSGLYVYQQSRRANWRLSATYFRCRSNFKY